MKNIKMKSMLSFQDMYNLSPCQNILTYKRYKIGCQCYFNHKYLHIKCRTYLTEELYELLNKHIEIDSIVFYVCDYSIDCDKTICTFEFDLLSLEPFEIDEVDVFDFIHRGGKI